MRKDYCPILCTSLKWEEITVQLCAPVWSEKRCTNSVHQSEEITNSVDQSEVRKDYCLTLWTSLKWEEITGNSNGEMTETPTACTKTSLTSSNQCCASTWKTKNWHDTVEQSHPMTSGSKWEDHGGGSFQTMLQVTNLPHANSTKNPFLLSVAGRFLYMYYYLQIVCVCACLC